jgi:hypothetical protein
LRLRFNEVIRVRLLIVGVIEVKLFELKFKFPCKFELFVKSVVSVVREVFNVIVKVFVSGGNVMFNDINVELLDILKLKLLLTTIVEKFVNVTEVKLPPKLTN